MKIIQLENVTKIFRKSHLGRVKVTTGIENVNLEINPGEVFGLLGLNGAGKTTTIKLLLGLLFPTNGKVTVSGQTMPNLDVLKKIGYLPEAAYINKVLTGREAVNIFAKLSKMPAKERKWAVIDILEKVGMTKSADKKIGEYSKGMVQRISMAQALIHNPDILIMDEPITGLDPLAILEVRQLILWLKAQGKTVFLSSHNISEVEKVCDRIAILTNGHLATVVESKEWANKEGKLEEIFTSTVQRTESIGPLHFV
jgi:ABC-2 type transport system ATP-binding protein